MPDIQRELDVERQVELWSSFLDSYTATETRAAVDVFLRGLIGGPRRHDEAA